MTYNTINNDMTMGGPDGALLAGRYRVVRQLGQGGMGSVWLAEDEKLDGFKVAIKMLPSVLVNNKRAYAQVKAEALVSLKLSHPNIVTVRAFEEEGGSPFLVMDYIDGQTLDDYLAEHCVATASSPSCPAGLPEDEVIRLLKPVAAALDYAHAQGVVHRDVKPGNVMIRKDGTPFVLDFGIAREIQETMTRVTGKLSSGTLMYMSPEQLRGDIPSAAQDVYSFAAMAYECLKGHPPFCRGQIEFQILHERPEPFDFSTALGESVLLGLAKGASARPKTCGELLVVVEQPGGFAFEQTIRSETKLPHNGIFRESAQKQANWKERERKPVADRVAWIALALLSLVLVAVVVMGSGREPAPDSAQGVPKFGKRLTAQEHAFAEARLEVCRRIGDGDGFSLKKRACEEEFLKAVELERAGLADDAAKSFNEVERQCREIVELDDLRRTARGDRSDAETASREAATLTADLWDSEGVATARGMMTQAASLFDAMQFSAAAEKYRAAASLLQAANQRAIRERQRGLSGVATDSKGSTATRRPIPPSTESEEERRRRNAEIDRRLNEDLRKLNARFNNSNGSGTAVEWCEPGSSDLETVGGWNNPNSKHAEIDRRLNDDLREFRMRLREEERSSSAGFYR